MGRTILFDFFLMGYKITLKIDLTDSKTVYIAAVKNGCSDSINVQILYCSDYISVHVYPILWLLFRNLNVQNAYMVNVH